MRYFKYQDSRNFASKICGARVTMPWINRYQIRRYVGCKISGPRLITPLRALHTVLLT